MKNKYLWLLLGCLLLFLFVIGCNGSQTPKFPETTATETDFREMYYVIWEDPAQNCVFQSKDAPLYFPGGLTSE